MTCRSATLQTQKSYLIQVSSFARHFRRSPELLGPEEIRAWLVYLREERKLAPASLGATIISAAQFAQRRR
ncbi:phage integrase N-terminal SAM-like domain-containing protein [Cupriavidus sp. IK-TO18]|uniref:phage integrase N-terminal SAM-like domain-containing protein n=1 Tax=Cupriavidus sp. IK-TO18 TaxID=2782182 RepID=UPI002104D36F|nr:phage integrase N-terminal SAM-like domain-containing protein [Cupriavidus sp. IK-TO18]